MFARKIYDINCVFKDGILNMKEPYLTGYTTQQSFTGFTLKNKNKFNVFKPDIQIKFDKIRNKVTVTANSIPKFIFLLSIPWMFLMIALFAIIFITGDFAFAIKFWIGIIISAWLIIPTAAIVISVMFRKASKQIFEEIHTQITNKSGDGFKTGDGSMIDPENN